MLSARLLLLFAVVIWGSTFVASKICLESMAPAELIGARFVLAVPLLLGIAFVRGVPLTRPKRSASLVWGVLIFSLHYFIQTAALLYTTATNSGWLVAATPLAIAVLSAMILRERIPASTRWGIAVASLGVILLVSRGQLTDLSWLSSIGDWMALATAFTWAAYTLLTREVNRQTHPLVVTILVHLPGAIVALVWGVLNLSSLSLTTMPSEAWLALLFLGIFGSALAQLFWQIGIGKLGSVTAGTFLYLEPLATTTVAIPILGESLGWFAVFGGTLILAGVYLSQTRTGNQ